LCENVPEESCTLMEEEEEEFNKIWTGSGISTGR
jgi:hypothetical protein